MAKRKYRKVLGAINVKNRHKFITYGTGSMTKWIMKNEHINSKRYRSVRKYVYQDSNYNTIHHEKRLIYSKYAIQRFISRDDAIKNWPFNKNTEYHTRDYQHIIVYNSHTSRVFRSETDIAKYLQSTKSKAPISAIKGYICKHIRLKWPQNCAYGLYMKKYNGPKTDAVIKKQMKAIKRYRHNRKSKQTRIINKSHWKQIDDPTLERHYYISDTGYVIDGKHNVIPEHSTVMSSKRYNLVYVILKSNGQWRRYPIKNLVAKYFMPHRNYKKVIQHKDGNAWHNNINNLCQRSRKIRSRYMISVHRKGSGHTKYINGFTSVAKYIKAKNHIKTSAHNMEVRINQIVHHHCKSPYYHGYYIKLAKIINIRYYKPRQKYRKQPVELISKHQDKWAKKFESIKNAVVWLRHRYSTNSSFKNMQNALSNAIHHRYTAHDTYHGILIKPLKKATATQKRE